IHYRGARVWWAGGDAAGRRTRNVVPDPGSLSTRSSPFGPAHVLLQLLVALKERTVPHGLAHESMVRRDSRRSNLAVKRKEPPTIVPFEPETPAGWASDARKRGTSFRGDLPGACKFYVLAPTSRKKMRKKPYQIGKSLLTELMAP